MNKAVSSIDSYGLAPPLILPRRDPITGEIGYGSGGEVHDCIRGAVHKYDSSGKVYEIKFFNPKTTARDWDDISDPTGLRGLLGLPERSLNPVGWGLAKAGDVLTNRYVTGSLTMDLAHHYGNGGGTDFVLSEQQMFELRPKNSDLDIRRIDNFEQILQQLNGCQKITLYKKHAYAYATLRGSLGHFSVYYSGVLERECSNKENWSFKGEMVFYDLYDFNWRTGGGLMNNMQGWIFRVVQSGDPYEVKSVATEVNQSSADDGIQWKGSAYGNYSDPVGK